MGVTAPVGGVFEKPETSTSWRMAEGAGDGEARGGGHRGHQRLF